MSEGRVSWKNLGMRWQIRASENVKNEKSRVGSQTQTEYAYSVARDGESFKCSLLTYSILSWPVKLDDLPTLTVLYADNFGSSGERAFTHDSREILKQLFDNK